MKQPLLRAFVACFVMICSPAFGQFKGAGSFAFTVSSASVTESAQVVVVSVVRQNGSRGAVTVKLSTSSGTATGGLDFMPVSGTLTFANGDAGPRHLKIEILEDALRERVETFTARLSSPTGGATLGTPSIETISILDSTTNLLALTSSVPANGSTGVNRSTPVQLNFNTTIDASTAPGNIRLQTAPGGIVVPTGMNVSGSQVTLTPVTRLDPLSQYTIRIDTGLRGVNGQMLNAAVNVNFTTRDRGWLGAQLVETENLGDADSSTVAIDANGNAWATWVQYNGARKSVRVSQYTPGSGWQIPATEIENNPGNSFNPQIAIDPSGNAIVAWQQQTSAGNYDTWANRFTVGVGWGTPTLIETGAGSALGESRIVMDAAGNATVVWPQSNADPSHQDIWANRYLVGSGWGAATLLGVATAGTSFEPRLGVDHAGNVVVTWRQPVVPAGLFSVWSNRFVVGSGWNGPLLVEGTNDQPSWPTVAVDGPGNAMALWAQRGATGPHEIGFNRFVPGAGWGTAAIFGLGVTSLDPQIELDSMGNGMAAWRMADAGPATFSTYARRYSITSGWEAPVRMDTASAGNSSEPQVGVDPAGNAISIWIRNDGTSNNIMANRFKAGLGWGTAELLEANVNHAFHPKMDVDANGNAMALWIQYDGTRYNIWSNRFE